MPELSREYCITSFCSTQSPKFGGMDASLWVPLEKLKDETKSLAHCGSLTFWVDADAMTLVPPRPSRATGRSQLSPRPDYL